VLVVPLKLALERAVKWLVQRERPAIAAALDLVLDVSRDRGGRRADASTS
jgi:hypothetical protein